MDENLDPSLEDLEEMMGMDGHFSDGPSQLAAFASQNAEYLQELSGFDPVKTAATFGALLTFPDLQKNCLRLETLVHFALFAGASKRKPSEKLVCEGFTALGAGICGMYEDPPEGQFVGYVRTPRGGFRILEGIWEGSSFFLQRFVDLAEAMPRGSGYDDIRETIYALLRLSELVCSRADLARYDAGSDDFHSTIPAAISGPTDSLHNRVRFEESELTESGIDIHYLAEFLHQPEDKEHLLKHNFGQTVLERRPIARYGDDIYLLLPSAVSVAIRRFVIERMDQAGMRPAFVRALGAEYADLFANMSLLGGRHAPGIKFQRTPTGHFASIGMRVDEGRWLQFIFILDTLEDFENTGLAGANPAPMAAADTLDYFINEASKSARQDPEFRDGISIIVGCGVGRMSHHAINNTDHKKWRIEFLSAADLETLSWLRNFKPLQLWRALDAQDRIRSSGLVLQNINGILNLVGWGRSLKGHLVPHAQLADDFIREDGHQMLLIDQSSIKGIRTEVASSWDPHVQRDVQGRWLNVRKEGQSIFDEDALKPHYAAEEWPPRGLYIAPNRTWWCSLTTTSSDMPKALAYERWKTVNVWLAKAAPVLDSAFPELPAGPVEWCATFDGNLQRRSADYLPLTFEEARNELTPSCNAVEHRVLTHATERYEKAFASTENIAERALVGALVDASALLANRTISAEEQTALVNAIVPGPMARQQHAFRSVHFRDMVQESLPSEVVIIQQEDDAYSRLGLGWKAREKPDGARIHGKQECGVFLNRLVGSLEQELMQELRLFNREKFLTSILKNHEAAAVDVERWHRTSAAVIALHDDKAAAIREIGNRESGLNAVFLSTRILIEFAICECSVTGGKALGDLELSRLMSKATLIFQFGGCSDAIKWDVMEPKLRVTPLGDVHANWEFVDEVVDPYARAAASIRIEEAVKDYDKNVRAPEITLTVKGAFTPEFLDAYREEMGASLDEVRLFVDFTEDLGLKANEAVEAAPKQASRSRK